jgi:rhodanese-related sulfurtransferase
MIFEEVFKIDSEKLKRMQMLHVLFAFFDIRPRPQYDSKHIPGALHLENLDHLKRLIPNKEMPVVIYDQDGIYAEEFARQAMAEGYLNIVMLEGGLDRF